MRANLNDRHTYAALIAASIVGTLLLAPALASAVSSIVSGNILASAGKLNANIVTASTISKNGKDGAFGYAVVTLNGLGGTGDSLMVATTHSGVLESVAQEGDPNSPVWHTHYVQLKGAGEYCADTNGGLGRLEVDNLSFQTPGTLKVLQNKVSFSAMPGSFSGTDSLTSQAKTWAPNTQASLVASFTLKPITTSDSVFHVCVENVAPVAAGS